MSTQVSTNVSLGQLQQIIDQLIAALEEFALELSEENQTSIFDRLGQLSSPSLGSASGLSGVNPTFGGVSGRKEKAGAFAGPAGFLWKPVSDSDGKLAILLPPKYSGRVRSVNILTPDGKRVIASGRATGVGNGGREHFRFDRAGSAFPAGSIVQIVGKDGNKSEIKIEKPAVRTEGR